MKMAIVTAGLAVGVALLAMSADGVAVSCIVPEPFSGSVLPAVGQQIGVGCTDSVSGSAGGRVSGVAGTSLTVRLLDGAQAVARGFNSSGGLVGTCAATDLTTGNGSVTDSTGCTGLARMELFVSD